MGMAGDMAAVCTAGEDRAPEELFEVALSGVLCDSKVRRAGMLAVREPERRRLSGASGRRRRDKSRVLLDRSHRTPESSAALLLMMDSMSSSV